MSESQDQMVKVEEVNLPDETDLKSERVQEEDAKPAEKRDQVQSTVLVTEIAVASRRPAVEGALAPEQVAVTVHGRRRVRSGPDSEIVEFAVKLGQ